MLTRRELLRTSGLGLASLVVPIRLLRESPGPLKFAVITDIHHGLAPDAQTRLDAFVAEVAKRRDLAFAVQMGDFCHAGPDSQTFLKRWSEISIPKLHVLGNHDMDKVNKAGAMDFWGMKARYASVEFGGWRFVILDLNNFRKDGKLVPYANGNYFTDNATHNWADPEQLEWLAKELHKGDKPTILLSHQPIGFAAPNQPLPPEQMEVLSVIKAAAKDHPAGAVAACLSGHMHVDRLEKVDGVPCLCVNSASYFWSSGMHAYTKPLFAFMEITASGELVVEGVSGEFVKPPPASSDGVTGRSGSIANRRIQVAKQV